MNANHVLPERLLTVHRQSRLIRRCTSRIRRRASYWRKSHPGNGDRNIHRRQETRTLIKDANSIFVHKMMKRDDGSLHGRHIAYQTRNIDGVEQRSPLYEMDFGPGGKYHVTAFLDERSGTWIHHMHRAEESPLEARFNVDRLGRRQVSYDDVRWFVSSAISILITSISILIVSEGTLTISTGPSVPTAGHHQATPPMQGQTGRPHTRPTQLPAKREQCSHIHDILGRSESIQ